MLPLNERAFVGFYGAGALLEKDGQRNVDFELPSAKAALPQPIFFVPTATKGNETPIESVNPITAMFPSTEKAPTADELKLLLARTQALKKPMLVGSAAYWGEDWTSKGDWVGRYGRGLGVLCAVMSPFDHDLTWNPNYKVNPQIGPHQSDDSVRAWLHWFKTNKADSLYDPILGYRRQAEWDDHGEEYPVAHEGPDTWIAVEVPQGLYRISLYFFNKDGKTANNRLRDYLVELKPSAPTTKQAFDLPTLARARVRDFGGGGVYKQFVVKGGERYYIKIARNGSFNTICSGVFIDKLSGPVTQYDNLPQAWLGDVRYDPPEYQGISEEISAQAPADVKILQRAGDLWSSVGQTIDRDGMAGLHYPARLMAYRVALKAGATEKLLANWRWTLCLWMPADRAEFNTVMERGHEAQLKVTPEIRGN